MCCTASDVVPNSSSNARTSASRARASRRAFAREQQIGDSSLQGEERAACGLSGMRRQHGPYVEAEHGALYLRRTVPVRMQRAHRPPRRRWLRLFVVDRPVRASPANTVYLLGGVDQQKEERERPGDQGSAFDR